MNYLSHDPLLAGLPVKLPDKGGPYFQSMPEQPPQPAQRQMPAWLGGAHQFAMEQFLRFMQSRQNQDRASYQMPYPMPATQGERDMLGMLPVAGDVEDMRYLMEGMQQGDPVKAGIGGAATALPFIPASLLHTVYHGSPHIFDAFRMDKIGTGEGAQVYGHGLYFAEEPGVASTYQGAAGWQPGAELRVSVDNEIIEARTPDEKAILQAGIAGDTDVLERRLSQANREAQSRYSSVSDAAKRHLEIARKVQRAKKIEPAQGALYEVEIPDEAVARMLDWDKPLSEQPENVQAAFSELAEQFPAQLKERKALRKIEGKWEPTTDLKGAVIYDRIAEALGGGRVTADRVGASEMLRQAGIPGIRYLDQMSRTGGEGTRNIVLFDDSLAKIIERK